MDWKEDVGTKERNHVVQGTSWRRREDVGVIRKSTIVQGWAERKTHNSWVKRNISSFLNFFGFSFVKLLYHYSVVFYPLWILSVTTIGWCDQNTFY